MTRIIAAAGAASGAVLACIVLAMFLKYYRRKAEDHPAVDAARRYALFAMDRPLPAEAPVERPRLRELPKAVREDYPACSPRELAAAVWEAEYNEFALHELEAEIRAVKKAGLERAVRRLALSELEWARKNMPHGVVAVFRTPRRAWKRRRGTLVYAHEWLRRIWPEETDATPAEQYAAVRSNRFRCAGCSRDWNDGARLMAVRTASGSLTVLCERCRRKREAPPEPDAAKETGPGRGTETGRQEEPSGG